MKSSDLKNSLLLYAVTDRRWLKDRKLHDDVEKAIKGGASFIQLREKDSDEDIFRKEAIEIKEVCRKYKVPFVINDNVSLAKSVDADGVHVGQSDMAASDVRKLIGDKKILGVSAQTVEEALLAEKQGADYLGVGAVFPTETKDNAIGVSYQTLQAICKVVKIPVIAIGGITAENILCLKDSGICGVAVISSIFASKDIENSAKNLLEICKTVF